ncbi:MAG TPA: ATP-binding cassette domain-containing protein, partial [Actinomycetes bacterium]|nr:ATP-binding cassette domain-containing protein [Actinomycetes bacterium]
MSAQGQPRLLEVSDLQVRFFTRHGVAQAVRNVSLELDKGETLGLVGESGSGKSVTAQAIMGLIHLPGKITAGDVRWKGVSLRGPDGARLARGIRGKEVAMVFQDPMTSLNPLFPVKTQIGEVLRHHLGMSRRQAYARVVELLELVGMPSPRRRAEQYPHEF